VALLCAVAGPAGVAHAAAAGSVTHSAGAVSATLAWDATAGGDAGDLAIDNPRLWAVRAGTRYDLTIADICDVGCVLTADSPSFPSILKVVDLDGDGEPEILADTFSGGAHCCLTTRIERWDGTSYESQDVQWGDVVYRVRDTDGDGKPELIGADDRFAYAFSAYADSGFPLLTYNLVGGRVTDTTKQHPKLIRSDAARWLKAVRGGGDIRGVLAAYAADEYLLGKGSTATREIAHQRKLKHISKTFGPFLLKKLHAWHYR
jgi:hypothetical protein